MSALPEVPATTPSSSPPTSRRFAVSAPRVFYPALGIILAVVMIGVCVAIYKAFRIEHEVLVVAERRQRREEMARRIGKTVTAHLEENFDDHFGEQVDGHIEAALTDDPARRPRWGRRPKA